MTGADETIAVRVVPARPLPLLEAGVLASMAATAFVVPIVATRLGGRDLLLALACCAILLIGLEWARRAEPQRLATVAADPRFVLAVCAALGFGLVAAGGMYVFLPALFVLLTFAVSASPPALALGSVLVAQILVAPGLMPLTSTPPSWAAAPGAAILVLLPLGVARLARSRENVTAAAAPDSPDRSASIPDLTPRQSEAVLLVCAGLRHGEIAERLGVSTPQVRRLLRQARERTGVATNRELVVHAIAGGEPLGAASEAKVVGCGCGSPSPRTATSSARDLRTS